jgi:hypothetical protein
MYSSNVFIFLWISYEVKAYWFGACIVEDSLSWLKVCSFYCLFALLLTEVFEGESYLLTIIIFCLLTLFVETDVLLFVSDNFDGDLCFTNPLPGETLL